MKILVVGDPHGKLPKKIPKNVDLILCTGDLGKADLARKKFFENVKREKKGLPEIENTRAFEKKVWEEVYYSSIKVAKHLSKVAPTYTLLGNVGCHTDSETKKEEKKIGIKLPYMRKGLSKIKDFNIVKNRVRNINGFRILFLEHFHDVCWDKEFNQKDKKIIRADRKETVKAKKILKGFGGVDILISHQPPHGVLDKVSGKYGAPKNWWGKHAGSKVVLDYIKKYPPKYVFCGHIHEGKGSNKIGKTIVINAGVNGDCEVVDVG
ncbi:MAG: metallophosphoesterase [archaeon]